MGLSQLPARRGHGFTGRLPTTNKFGRWCAPKKSTYQNAVTVVVRGYREAHSVVWLSVGNPAVQWGGTHVCVRYANGEGYSLAKCWRNDAPRRVPHTYTTTWTKSKLSITGPGVEPGEPTVEKETTTLDADSPEECDAWDVWVEVLKALRQLLRNVWTAAETVPV